MNKKEKLLLFTDLSPRLPYGVRVNFKENRYDSRKWKISTLYAPSYNQSGILIDTDHDGWIDYVEYKGCGMSTGSRPLHLGEVLPYLRPMSSMTEEEFQELHSMCPHSAFNKTNVPGWIIGISGSDYGRISRIDEISKLIDWLNKHYFDYRGLIDKGLALEAPEGMYEKAW